MDRFLIKLKKSDDATDKAVDQFSSSTTSTSTSIANENGNKDTDTDTSQEEESDCSIKNDNRKITKKRIYKQKFRDVWNQKFEWIECKESDKLCKVCNVVIQGAGFHLKRHAQSRTHQIKYNAALRTPNVTKYFDENNEKVKLSSLINEAELKMSAYLCEHNLPFRLIDSLPALCASMFPDSKIASGLKIKRKKATRLVSALGDVSCDELIKHLQVSDFSLIIDETTDISTQKSLVVVARFWDNKSGKVKDRFLSLLEVEDASAQGLFNLIKRNILDKYKIPPARIIGFAADNCSVMMGNISGVQALLREINPHIVVVGCTSHSLHLCASQAAKKLPNSVEQLARDIYGYFAHSSKRIGELKECQIFALETPSKLLYPSQVRWLSLRQVADRILLHWNSLKLFFGGEAVGNSNAQALSIALNKPIFKVYFLFLSYVLELITKINLEFQSENSKLPLLLDRVSALYKIILKSFVKREIINNHPDEFFKINIDCPHYFKELEEIYFGAKVDLFLNDLQSKQQIDINDLKNFRIKGLDFYIQLCKEISKRFNFSDPYLKYASLFTPKTALCGDVLSVATFKNLFPNINVDVETVNCEWQLLSEMDHLKKNGNLDVTEFWCIVNKEKNSLHQPMFPNLMKVVRYVLTLPHSSAVCERLFSWLTLIKTKQRNKLLIKTCNNILHVKDRLKNGGYNFSSLGKNITEHYETDGDIIDICDIFDY